MIAPDSFRDEKLPRVDYCFGVKMRNTYQYFLEELPVIIYCHSGTNKTEKGGLDSGIQDNKI